MSSPPCPPSSPSHRCPGQCYVLRPQAFQPQDTVDPAQGTGLSTEQPAVCFVLQTFQFEDDLNFQNLSKFPFIKIVDKVPKPHKVCHCVCDFKCFYDHIILENKTNSASCTNKSGDSTTGPVWTNCRFSHRSREPPGRGAAWASAAGQPQRRGQCCVMNRRASSFRRCKGRSPLEEV